MDFEQEKEKILTSYGERSHEQTKANNHSMGHVNQSLSAGTWVEVGLVDIIGEDGRHGDELSRAGRCDSHEDDQERADGTTRAEECDGSVRQDKTGRDVRTWHAEGVGRESWVAFESKSSKTHGGGTKPWNSEPRNTSHDVTRESVDRGSRNGLVVVTVVQEHTFGFVSDVIVSR